MHRDIKPGNVVIADDGRGVLVDFSFVRLTASSLSQASLMGGAASIKGPRRRAAAARQQEQGRAVAAPPTGALGTPSYIAPEVLAEENYDETCDLWSCGVVALELLRDEFLGVERDRAALKLVRTLRETLSSKAPGCVVRALLQDEPSRRCRAAEALELLGGGAALLPSAPLSPPFDLLRLELPAEAERALDQLDGRTPAARAYAARALELVPGLDPRHAALLAVKLAEGQAPACDELDLHYRDVRAAELRVLMAADGCLLYASPFPTAAVVEARGGGGGS
jgi:serine/threonine protein kinase